MEVNTIAIDLAKNVFALCGANAAGKLIWHKELRRTQLLGFMRKLRPCVVGMEACGGAHYWARQLAAMGYEIRLVSPALVTPYRKGNETDRNDAEAILEAVTSTINAIRGDQERRTAGLTGDTPSAIAAAKEPHCAMQSAARIVARARSCGTSRRDGT